MELSAAFGTAWTPDRGVTHLDRGGVVRVKGNRTGANHGARSAHERDTPIPRHRDQSVPPPPTPLAGFGGHGKFRK